MHMHLEVLFKATFFESITVGDPGNQGAVVTGMHGTGAPCAAATAGLDGVVHIKNGMMFFIGI